MGQDIDLLHRVILEPWFYLRQADAHRSSRTSVQSEPMSYPGQRIKQLRNERGLTQEQVAAAAGVSQKAISLLERDIGRVPEAQTLQKLAKFFDVDADWLLTGKGVKNPVAALSEEEAEILLLFRAVSDEAKAYLLKMCRDLHAGEYRSRPKPLSDPINRPASGLVKSN